MQNKLQHESRIFLRALSLNDANGPYLTWLNDPEVNRYLETRFQSWSQSKLENYIHQFVNNSNEFLFAICLLDGGIHIGNIKLGPVNWNHRFGEIGLLIGEKNYWGNGFASEAIGLMCKFAFDNLKLHKLKAGCYAENEGSVRAFLRNGFVVEGCLKKQWFIENRYQDGLQFGLLSEDYYVEKH